MMCMAIASSKKKEQQQVSSKGKQEKTLRL